MNATGLSYATVNPEPGLDVAVLNADIVAPVPVALLHPAGIHRVHIPAIVSPQVAPASRIRS